MAKVLCIWITAALTIALAAASTQPAHAGSSDVVGSWQILANYNTSSGSSFTSGWLLTINGDGTVIQNDNFPPPGTTPIFTAGHGVWTKSSTKGGFHVDFLKLRLDSTNTFDRYVVEVVLESDVALSGTFAIPSLGVTGTFAGTLIEVTPR